MTCLFLQIITEKNVKYFAFITPIAPINYLTIKTILPEQRKNIFPPEKKRRCNPYFDRKPILVEGFFLPIRIVD
jgi:hypothetical protein